MQIWLGLPQSSSPSCSSFNSARGQSLDKVPLQEHKDNGDWDGGHNRGCHHIAPIGGCLTQECHHKARGQCTSGGVRNKGHGIEQIVPAPNESINCDRNHSGDCHGKNDLGHNAPVAGTIDFCTLNEGIWNLVEVSFEGPGSDRKREYDVAYQQRPVAAQQAHLIHQSVNGQQQNCLRKGLTHHKEAHNEFPAAITEFCEAVSGKGAYHSGQEAGAEGDNQAVFQIGHNIFVGENVDDVVHRQGASEKITAECLAGRFQCGINHPQEREENEEADTDKCDPEKNSKGSCLLKHLIFPPP